MQTTIKAIVDEIRRQLQDARKAYWSDEELLDAVNGGRSIYYTVKPEIYEATEPVILAEGFRQTLPNASNLFFRAIDNISHISQRAITTVDAQLLSRARPRWRTLEPTDEIVHVMYDKTSPGAYECYPPAKAGTRIRISYAKPPAAISLTELNSASPPSLTAEGANANALIDYGLHRAFGKQSDTSPDAGQLSGDYLRIFMAKIAGQEQAQQTRSTNATARGMAQP